MQSAEQHEGEAQNGGGRDHRQPVRPPHVPGPVHAQAHSLRTTALGVSECYSNLLCTVVAAQTQEAKSLAQSQ